MDDERDVLQAVLDRYGLVGARTELLGSLWNHVYRVETADGRRCSLRLCNPAIRQSRSVEEELSWLEWIAGRQQVQVPRPIRNREQELVTAVPTPEGARLGCLFEWVAGEPARGSLTPAVMRGIGQAVAGLHSMAREAGGPFEAGDFRSGYQYGSRLAASHLEWIETRRAEIGEETASLLSAAVAWLLAALARMGESPDKYGLIHADLHFGNFLVYGGRVSVIDFDQLGWGHYAYDLAVLQVELRNEVEECAALWEDLVAGYRQVAPLPYAAEGELAALTVAVDLAFLDWVYNSPSPAVRRQMGPRVAGTLAAIGERIV